jgi:2-C-methyl-D-erythritol 4-phosphate cytidylyltransferase
MTVALIVAAGSGERLGAGRPKAAVELAGDTLLNWSLVAIAATPSVSRVVVALPPELVRSGFEVRREGGYSIELVEGGESRSQSVLRALEVAGEDDIVLVHDAARPLVTPALAGAVLDALRADERADAAIAAAPVTDTIKRVDEGLTVTETLNRSELWSVQTPQVFRRGALRRALEVSPQELAAATDDAWLIQRAGGRVLVVPSPAENIKVTTPVDLRLAELLLEERARRGG